MPTPGVTSFAANLFYVGLKTFICEPRYKQELRRPLRRTRHASGETPETISPMINQAGKMVAWRCRHWITQKYEIMISPDSWNNLSDWMSSPKSRWNHMVPIWTCACQVLEIRLMLRRSLIRRHQIFLTRILESKRSSAALKAPLKPERIQPEFDKDHPAWLL